MIIYFVYSLVPIAFCFITNYIEEKQEQAEGRIATFKLVSFVLINNFWQIVCICRDYYSKL
jgi:hypothetical protein